MDKSVFIIVIQKYPFAGQDGAAASKTSSVIVVASARFKRSADSFSAFDLHYRLVFFIQVKHPARSSRTVPPRYKPRSRQFFNLTIL